MAKVEKYGLKMVGLRAAASETKSYMPYLARVEIHYDTASGQIYHHYRLSQTDYWVPADSDIIFIADLYGAVSMQYIADLIAAKMRSRALDHYAGRYVK